VNRALLFKIYKFWLAGMAAGVTAACLVWLYRTPPTDTWTTVEAVVLIPAYWLCAKQKVYFTESSAVLLGTMVQIGAIIVLPLPLAVAVLSCAKAVLQLSEWKRQRLSAQAALINVSITVLSLSTAGGVFQLLDGPSNLWSTNPLAVLLAVPALGAMAVLYLVSDSTYVAVVITLRTKDHLIPVLRKLIRDTFGPDLSLLVVGIVFGLLLHATPLLSPLVIVPVFLSMRSFAAVARLRDETERSIMHLARSVDMRDVGTGVHSQQLEQAATRLATALGLIPEHVHEIGLAARAHDLGKIEISDAILLKPGPLTPEERAVMQEHPAIGADMLASFSAFDKSVAYVRHHHERWDGKGYPDRLKGEDIPIGARIIAVVDSYDAMTADRPYRKAMSSQEAVKRLKDAMGTQFDPRICATWVQLLIEDGTYIPEDEEVTQSRLQIVSAEAG
jgi:hypothetical protein